MTRPAFHERMAARRPLAWFAILVLTAACGTPAPDATPDREQQRRELAGVEVTIDVEDLPLAAVLARLSELTGRSIGMTEDAAAHHADLPTDLMLQEVSLLTALSVLEAMAEDLVWIPEGRGALFDLRSNHQELLVVQIHALGDLTSGLTSGGWAPPAINEEALDEDLADEDTPLFLDPHEDDGLDAETVEQLVAEIRAAFPAGTWDAPADLRMQGLYTLVAKQTPAIQEELAEFLDEWRSQR